MIVMIYYWDDIKFNLLFWVLCIIILLLLIFPYYRFKKEKVILPMWVYYVWLFTVISLALSLLCLFAFVFPYTKWNVEAVSITIVLTFVGILATFVVVSNYQQVKDIQIASNKKIEEIKEEYANLNDIKNIDISNIYTTLKYIHDAGKEESWCLFSMLSLSNSSFFKHKIDSSQIKDALATLIPKIREASFNNDHLMIMNLCIETFRKNSFYSKEIDEIEKILKEKQIDNMMIGLKK